jgi:hypothetical protein
MDRSPQSNPTSRSVPQEVPPTVRGVDASTIFPLSNRQASVGPNGEWRLPDETQGRTSRDRWPHDFRLGHGCCPGLGKSALRPFILNRLLLCRWCCSSLRSTDSQTEGYEAKERARVTSCLSRKRFPLRASVGTSSNNNLHAVRYAAQRNLSVRFFPFSAAAP